MDYNVRDTDADKRKSVLLQKQLVQMRMYDPFSVNMLFREYEFEMQNQGLQFWKSPEQTSFMNLHLDTSSMNQATREQGSLFEVRIGLDRVITRELSIFEGPVPLPLVAMIGGLLFLAQILVYLFNEFFMARLLSMEVVKSIYKYAEPNSSAFLGKTSLTKMAEERPVSWLSYASEFRFGCCMKFAQMCCC